jgi:uncharacterized protein (TIGR03085 family)
MAHFAVTERHALAETLRSVGPDAPTRCGDWTAAQLAAHLVLRERSVIELGGQLPVRAFRRKARAALDDYARRPYAELVDAVDGGPSWRDVVGPVPVAWIWSLPPVREQANLLEYLVHHEDVRRAQPGWAPRALPRDLETAVWRRLPWSVRLTMRDVRLGVALQAPGYGEVRTGRARRHGVAVTVRGAPVELALFAFGRQDVADVEYDGRPEDVDALRSARMGI